METSHEHIAVDENVELSNYTTLRIGGPARYFVTAQTRDDVVRAISWARERGVPVLTLGGGSNLLVGDDGFDGLVVHVAIRGFEAVPNGDAVEVTVGAGEGWDDVVARVVAQGWAGIECLSGIPGSCGASPIQNIGAYGQEVRETISRVEAIDLRTLETATFAHDECDFGYRHSRFKGADAGRYVVTGVTYRLMPGGAPAVRYADLERRLKEHGLDAPTLQQVRDLVLSIRREKSMVLDPGDPDARSAGSFFMNPIVEESRVGDVERRVFERLGADTRMPRFPAGEGHVKLSAAWLIERAGFHRGHTRGRARLSTKHTLAIVNGDAARAEDIVALAREVRDGVEAAFGVRLVPEPVFVGCTIDS